MVIYLPQLSPSYAPLLSITKDLLVAYLVGHRVGEYEARVLVDVTAAVRLAHTRHLGEAQGTTRLIHA